MHICTAHRSQTGLQQLDPHLPFRRRKHDFSEPGRKLLTADARSATDKKVFNWRCRTASSSFNSADTQQKLVLRCGLTYTAVLCGEQTLERTGSCVHHRASICSCKLLEPGCTNAEEKKTNQHIVKAAWEIAVTPVARHCTHTNKYRGSSQAPHRPASTRGLPAKFSFA